MSTQPFGPRQPISVQSAALRRAADVAATPTHLRRFADDAASCRIAPAAWGDQPELAAAAQRWQAAFATATATMTGGVQGTAHLIRQAAQAYQAHDAASADAVRGIGRRIDRARAK